MTPTAATAKPRAARVAVDDETPLLETRGLTMRFGGVTALDALDLAVREHEILGLLGPNGSGKTTFFNVVTGLYRPSAGTVLLGGVPITGASAQAVYRAGVTRTFQRSRLSLPLTVFDNVAIGRNRQLDPGLGFNLLRRGALARQFDETVAEVHALLATFSPAMAAKLWRPAGALSMIDRRRVEVCRALVSNPRLLLLDEPSAGMTHDETRALMDDLLAVRSRLSPFTVVIIEHEMAVIQRITDRCAVLNYGQKIAEGSYAQITADPQVQVAYLGQDAADASDVAHPPDTTDADAPSAAPAPEPRR